MKSLHHCVLIILFFTIFDNTGSAQKVIKKINSSVNQDKIYTDMMYLASDALKGRKTGEPGNQQAANYIADQFKKAGVKTIPGMNGYFQPIPFVKYVPPLSGTLSMGGTEYVVKNNLVILDGGAINKTTEAIYADYGWVDAAKGRDDYQGLEVKGKYVIVQGGLPEGGSPAEIFSAMPLKRKMAADHGALGLIEIYNLSFPWNFFRNYFSKERLEIVEGAGGHASVLHAWLQLPTNGNKPTWSKGKSYPITINTPGAATTPVEAVNVLGMIPGKKKKLRDQYILLSAHFDHVGVKAGQPIGNDTIWNGARDNAWGTVGLLAAARYFAKNPPNRSVMIAAVNCEEIGLLGSKYLAEHPVMPWNKVIFDLNSDGAGYSDTTLVSIIGLNRVGAADEMNTACKAFGLTTIADPAPEQGLFDRSDNVSFAQLGIPAPTFAAGFKTFDQEVGKYYHQAIDNPDNISYGYLHRFTKAFLLSALQIANKIELPRWSSGDKYETAGKKLYGY